MCNILQFSSQLCHVLTPFAEALALKDTFPSLEDVSGLGSKYPFRGKNSKLGNGISKLPLSELFG